MHTFTGNNTRSHHFNPAVIFGIDRSFAIQGFAHRRDNPAEDRFTNRHLGDLAGSFDNIAFSNMNIFTHNSDTHIVFLKVQHQTQDTARKLDEFQS